MDLWVFDNDGTLYDDRAIHALFMPLLYGYLERNLGIESAKADGFLATLKEKWGTEISAAALTQEYGIEFASFVEETYLQINLEHVAGVEFDVKRRNVLELLDGPKVVLTNNPSIFAESILDVVGLLKLFQEVIGIEKTGLTGKPNPRAYQAVETRYPEAKRIFFCDDSIRNLDGARERGWVTILYKPNKEAHLIGGHRVISSFEELLT